MSTYIEDTYEQAVISLFRDTLGYTYECGYDVERDHTEPCYMAVLKDSIRRLNPGIDEYNVGEIVKKLKNICQGTLIQNNEAFMEMLQTGVDISVTMSVSKAEPVSYGMAAEGITRTVKAKLIDYKNIENNDFRIVNQWTVEELAQKRCDAVVFINGLPLVVIELKSATSETATIDNAYAQIRNYQQVLPRLFAYNAFNVISDLTETRAGTITAKQSRYMEWKTVDGSYESTQVADYRTFFEGIFEKSRLIDIIQNFICFDKIEGAIGKVMCAYHQYYAVNKALARTKTAINSDGRIGVFWHTQGSGKSFSMVFYAHLLIQTFPEVTIVVVTDRKDLDNQLMGQFARCSDFLRVTPQQANSREHLGELLRNRRSGGIIFTTIQKFEEGETALSLRSNIIVVTDEAHRSQYGDEYWDSKTATIKKGQARKMREALPGASFIGFTGTPISDRDRDTEAVFGNYIDIYDMTQAVEDGATKPVYYESRVVNIDLSDEALEMLNFEFDALTDEGATDEQIKKAKQEHSRLEVLLGDDDTLNSLVKDIVQHYENNRQYECSGKAMIVAYSRGIAIKIYKKMLELRPDWMEKVKVVMSSSNNDPEEWQQIIGNEKHKQELAKKFKDDNDPMKIAIVRDMWLTGFDVPSLATMYVYKAMSGHNLMQAIARVNRVFAGKEGGLVVDYIGIAQALRTAMKQYTSRDRARFGDPDVAKAAMNRWKEELEICQDTMHGFNYEGFFCEDAAKRSEAITDGVNFLCHIDRESRKKDMLEHSRNLHNATTLCKSLLTEKQKTEVCYFDALRITLQRLGQKGKISKQEINERISNLLKQSIKSEGVINLFADRNVEFSLFDKSFMEDIRKMKQKNLAIELLKKLLKEKVQQSKTVSVVQSELFSDMLSSCLSKYLKGLLTNEEVVEELLKLAEEIKKSQEDGEKLGLTPEEKAFYDALSKPEGVRQAYNDDEFLAMTKELTETLRKNRTIDWNKKESARAKMKVMVKRLLKKYKYPPKGAEEAIKVVMAQCDRWAENEIED